MGDVTTIPSLVITDINDVDIRLSTLDDANNTPDITLNNDVTNATSTQTPGGGDSSQVLPSPPPPSTSTTTAKKETAGIESTTAAAAAATTTTTTTITSSSTSSQTTVAPNEPRPVACPDLFTISNEDFEKNHGKIRDDHHHTIIINNKNKAVILDHKNRGDNDNNIGKDYSNTNDTYINIDSRERTTGAIVTAICSHGAVPLTVTFLECQANGKWNASLPHCHGSLDVSSNTLYFSVIGGVCGVTILILALLYFLMMKTKRRDRGPVPPPLDPDKAMYVDPYAVGERLYSIPAPVHYPRGDITYAKPQIYSTYLNPSFYEDAYQRWRRQEQQVSEKLYDSPFMNRRMSNAWPDNQDPTWTLSRADNSKQIDKLQIPRAKITPMDQGSVRSHDSVSTLTFTGPRSQRVVYGRQPSVVSATSTMPRYGNTNIPRRQHSQYEPPPGLHLVKAYEDVPPPPLPEMEVEYLQDDRTPF